MIRGIDSVLFVFLIQDRKRKKNKNKKRKNKNRKNKNKDNRDRNTNLLTTTFNPLDFDNGRSYPGYDGSYDPQNPYDTRGSYDQDPYNNQDPYNSQGSYNPGNYPFGGGGSYNYFPSSSSQSPIDGVTHTTIWNLNNRDPMFDNAPTNTDYDYGDENDPNKEMATDDAAEANSISMWTIYTIVGAVAGVILLIGLLAITIAVCCRRDGGPVYKSTPV